ncbi:GIY-YIG nuclease family protein [Budvicia diplopodorum]|uniref:GIY-YIG nuclease family protein n=1 Tax=Budvicia diplopodorum TaxID=1119056 RepID=UPI001359253C|nr:GIY-YIG nuclease family protein [Budvicia diplopodorum]
MLRTADNRLYTGITTSIERRFKQHQTGKGAKALRGAGLLTLVYQQKVGGRSEALKLEYRIKQLSKQQKERLVSNQAIPIDCWNGLINNS